MPLPVSVIAKRRHYGNRCHDHPHWRFPQLGRRSWGHHQRRRKGGAQGHRRPHRRKNRRLERGWRKGRGREERWGYGWRGCDRRLRSRPQRFTALDAELHGFWNRGATRRAGPPRDRCGRHGRLRKERLATKRAELQARRILPATIHARSHISPLALQTIRSCSHLHPNRPLERTRTRVATPADSSGWCATQRHAADAARSSAAIQRAIPAHNSG
jgi:hypothetical protein